MSNDIGVFKFLRAYTFRVETRNLDSDFEFGIATRLIRKMSLNLQILNNHKCSLQAYFVLNLYYFWTVLSNYSN